MTPAQALDQDHGATASPTHLVVKRGHHGRYRFAMLTANGRLKGEVQIEMVGDDRKLLHAQALAKISSVAHEISAAIALKIAAISLEVCGPTTNVGHEIAKDGGRRGAI